MIDRRTSKFAFLGVAPLLFGCTDGFQTDYTKYQEIVSSDFRNPSSAEFRNERVRNLWSSEGSRLKMYCAEVNADNEFGGKTGFQFVRLVISTKYEKTKNNEIYSDNAVFIDKNMNDDFYIQCVRADTERSNDKMFMITPQIEPFNPESKLEMDKYQPVLSSLPAPEDR